MGKRVASLKRQAAVETAVDCKFQAVITAGTDVLFYIHRTEGVGTVWVSCIRWHTSGQRIKLIQGPNAIPVNIHRGITKIHGPPGKKAHSMRTEILRGKEKTLG